MMDVTFDAIRRDVEAGQSITNEDGAAMLLRMDYQARELDAAQERIRTLEAAIADVVRYLEPIPYGNVAIKNGGFQAITRLYEGFCQP